MSKKTTKSVNVTIISQEALLNYIASNNDYDVNETQALGEILEMAKMVPRSDFDYKNTIKARNHILIQLNLELRM